MQGNGPALPAGEAMPAWAEPADTDPAFAPSETIERPRAFGLDAKLAARGVESLTAGELLAAIAGHDLRDGARRALDEIVRLRGVRGLAAVSYADWLREPGMKADAAASLAAALELGRRVHGPPSGPDRPRIARPRDAFELTRDLASTRKEHLVGLYLDAQNGLIARETVSIGSLNTTRTHPREILYPAIAHLALGFVLVHNHPSGCLEPSEEDVEFTRSVRRAGELMGIELYDHLVVAASGFTSLRERGAI